MLGGKRSQKVHDFLTSRRGTALAVVGLQAKAEVQAYNQLRTNYGNPSVCLRRQLPLHRGSQGWWLRHLPSYFSAVLAITGNPPVCFADSYSLSDLRWLFSRCGSVTARISFLRNIDFQTAKRRVRNALSVVYCFVFGNQTMPCAIIASATLRKPATFAPTIMSPGLPHSMEAFRHSWKMLCMMPLSFASTSSKVQL